MDAESLLELYLAGHIAAGHSLRTVEWYRYEVGRFFSWLIAAGLHNGDWLRPEVIEAYLAHSREVDGNAPATVAGHYRALQGFCNWLVRRGYIGVSPLAQVAPPKVPKVQPRRAELAEYDRLLSSIPIAGWVELRDRLVINVLFLCGLRLAECARLTAADFRTGEHLLAVRQGKGGHDRLVPLLPAVERAFVQYLYVRPSWPATDHIFLGADGAGNARGPILPGGIRTMVKRRCRRAGLRALNPHSFRHGLAMMLLNRGGADMSLVQKILGHSQISTTARSYAEWLTDGMLREFTEKMKGVGGA
jgi:site-specific recombinase XerD